MLRIQICLPASEFHTFAHFSLFVGVVNHFSGFSTSLPLILSESPVFRQLLSTVSGYGLVDTGDPLEFDFKGIPIPLFGPYQLSSYPGVFWVSAVASCLAIADSSSLFCFERE